MTPEEAKYCIEEIRTEKLRANSEDLRAALKLLAEELNTKETHFILELLQNAEDNEYGAKEPQLNLSVVPENLTGISGTDGCFVMINNETGFQRQNVRSLSSVGQSTKKHRLHGYIGEKGIGFKSVFRITSSPHIFSNGFQFRFELPNDTEELGYILPHWVNEVPAVVKEGETTMILPLLPGKKQLIVEQLSKIAPETVLFLRKLKSLKFSDDRVISRDGTLPFITVKHNGEEKQFYVHVEECHKPDNLAEEKRKGIDMREVAITFPLNKEATSKGKVFAFLPTEFNTGLPFIVNADFILNFNRERVLEGRPWNQWLRDQVAPTFVKAFLALLNEKEWRLTANRFLPVETELTPDSDFFSPVVVEVIKLLKEQACVLTDSDLIALPKSVLSTGRTARELLAEVPRERHKFLLLNETWEAGWQTRLKPLGVESLKFIQLFDLCNDVGWLKTRSLDWWEKLLELACSCNVKENDIQDFPILLCQDGIPRPISNGVFFGGESQPNQSEFLAEWPPALMLHGKLQTRLEGKSSVFRWLESVTKIQNFSITAYVSGKLLPWMSSQSGERAPTALVNAARFIAKHLSSFDEQNKQALARKMSWVLAGNQILTPHNRKDKELVFPECFEKEDGWNLVFADADDRRHFYVLSDEYFDGCLDDERELIKKLMSACGVITFPDPAKRVDADGLRDWQSPQWLKELTDANLPANIAERSQAIEKWIQRFELRSFSRFFVYGREEWAFRVNQESKDSEFFDCLKNRPWMKSSKGFVCPSRAFLDDAEIRSFLGESVAYASTGLTVAGLEIIGVGVRLTLGTLLNLLRQMRDKGILDKALAVRTYQRLQTIEFDSAIFRNEPLILLTEPTTRWETLNRVFWVDVGPVFDEEFGYAVLTYENDDLHGFFTKKLLMAPQPEPKEYADIWVGMSQSDSIVKEIVEAKMERILPEMAKLEPTAHMLSWWMRFKPRAKIWTTNRQFEAKSSVFVPDDANAEGLFKDSAKIAWVPEHYSAVKINSFLRSIGCPSLSEHIKSSATISEPTKFGNYDRFLTKSTRELLVCWVCRYEGWTDRKVLLESLLRTEEVFTPRITLQHSIDQENVPTKEQEIAAHWEPSKQLLYLRENAPVKAQHLCVANSIANKFFRNSQAAEDTVYRLLGLEMADAEWEMAERKWTMSASQQEWIKSLAIELQILRVKEKDEKRKPRGKIQTDNQLESTTGTTGGTSDVISQTTKPQEKQELPEAPLANKASGTLEQKDAEPSKDSQTQTTITESGDVEDLNEVDEAPLKPPDTEVEFVHVSGYARSARKRRQRDQWQATAQREEKSGLTETSAKSKQDLEDLAVAIIVQQFKINVDFAGYELQDRRKGACGYDLLAQKAGAVLRIEVKAHARESKSVFVTKREWDESRIKDQVAREDRWELWNVENLVSDTAKAKITRYGTVPEEARSAENGYWLNLNACSR